MMKTLFSKAQWWRSPPALVLSVIAAAALLFFSGKAALNAFAEGEEEKTYVVQFITGVDGYKANAAGTTYEGVPATMMTVTNNPENVYLLNAVVPQKDKYHFRRWRVHNAGTGGDEYYTSNSSLPVSYFSRVGETNVYVTTATAEFDRKLVVKYDKDTTDNVSSMPATATFYDSNTAYADGYTLAAGTSTVRQGYIWKRWLRTPGGDQAVAKLAMSDFDDSTWNSTEKAYVITVYADWNKAYRVRYDFNGGKSGSSNYQNVDFDLPPDQTGTYSFDGSIVPSRAGYTFRGWASDNSNDPSKQLTSLDLETDFVLTYNEYKYKLYKAVYAIWEENVYTFTYVANLPSGVTNSNVSDVTETKTYSEVSGGYSFTPQAPTADGCSFLSWTLEYDVNGTPYSSIRNTTAQYRVDANLIINSQTRQFTMTASWKKLYKLNFDPNAGGDTVAYALSHSDTITSSNFDANGDYTFSFSTAPTRTGYIYNGASLTPGGSIVTKVNESQFDTLEDGRWNATIYGSWTKRPVITYHSAFPDYSGGQLTESKDGNIGSQTAILHPNNLWSSTTVDNATKGCQFLYWHGDDGNDYNANANYDITGDLTLDAVWNKQFALTYLPSGSYYSGAEGFTVRSDQIASSSTHQFITSHPTRNGYDFAGWSLTDGGTEAIPSIPLSVFTLNASGTAFEATVYAVWTPKSSTVNYQENLPEGFTASGMPADESFTSDDLGDDLKWYWPDETPTADGYTFLGWDMIIRDSDGESQHEAFCDKNLIFGNGIVWDFARFASAVVKARWQKNFTVFYDYNVEEGVTVSDGISGTPPTKRDFSNVENENEPNHEIIDGKYALGNDNNLKAKYYRTDDSGNHSYLWKGWAKTADAALSDCVTQLDEADFIYNAGTDRFEATVYGTWQRKAEITWHYILDSLEQENQAATYVTKGNPGFTGYPVYRPHLTHHILDGWTTNEDGTGTFYGVDDTITTDEDMDLYAVLSRRFKLRYFATSPYTGNSAVMPGENVSPNLSEEVFTVPVSEIGDDTVHPMFDDEPILTGAQDRYFIGWSYTNNTGTGEGLLDDDAIALSLFEKTANATNGVGYYVATVFSLWSEKPYSVIYTSTLPEGSVVTAFPENAAALTYSQVRHGYRISSVTPTAPGYNFTQYYTYSQTLGETASVHGHASPGGLLSYHDFFGSDQQVRAQANWTQNRQFVLDANADDDTVESTSYSGAPITVYDFSASSTFGRIYASATRVAHVLDYWALDAEGNNPLPDPDSSYEVSADHFVLNQENNRFECTVYAMWKRHYNVMYDGNADGDRVYGVPANGSNFYESTRTAEKPLVDYAPTRSGYVFKGWALSPNATEALAENKIPLNLDTFTLNREKEYYEATVYALWERNATCTVTYTAGEGSGADVTETVATGSESSVKEGDIFTPPAGKEFDCWQCDTEGYSTTPGQEITVDDNIVYTAVWKTVYYTLRYDKGEVTAITSTLPAGRSDITWADLRAGGVVISETLQQVEGYTFIGWKITNGDDDSIFKVYDASRFGALSTSEKLVDEALFDSSRSATAVAQWLTNYTVTYNVSGIPSGFDYPPSQTDSYPEGTVVPIKDKPAGFDEDAYEFIGWSSDEIDTEQSSFTVNGNIVITGEFRAKALPPQPVTYTVTYRSGDDPAEAYTDADISGDYTLLGIGDTGFAAPDGMRFDSWKLVTPGDKGYPETAAAGENINVVSDVTYKAVWSTASPVFPMATITYTSGLTEEYPGYNESCAGTFVIHDVPTAEEYAVLGNDPQNESNPSFAPDGYTFAGWKLVVGTGGSSPTPRATSGSAGEDGLYHEGDTVATADLTGGSVTLKAMWNCKLRYDANEGSGTLPGDGNDITQFVGDNVTVANGSGLKLGDLSFAYWSTTANDETGSTHYSPSARFVIKEDTVLYAIYTDSPGGDTSSGEPDGTTFTLTYKANGGSGNVPRDENRYSAGATVPVASKGDLVRTGCTFLEWNTKPDGSGTGYKGDGSDSFIIHSDTTIYAVWLDSSGKIVPSPGTGESGLPMIIAFGAALLSLAAFAFIVTKERGKA